MTTPVAEWLNAYVVCLCVLHIAQSAHPSMRCIDFLYIFFVLAECDCNRWRAEHWGGSHWLFILLLLHVHTVETAHVTRWYPLVNQCSHAQHRLTSGVSSKITNSQRWPIKIVHQNYTKNKSLTGEKDFQAHSMFCVFDFTRYEWVCVQPSSQHRPDQQKER